jgi:integrase
MQFQAERSSRENRFHSKVGGCFGNLKLNQLTTWQVRDLMHRKVADGLAKGTVNRILCLTRHLFNLALEWETPSLSKNPAKGVRSFEENNKVERYLTPQEALALKHALNESDNPSLKYIVAFLLVTGARKQEALKARWQDIDFHANVWRIPLAKSDKVRYIPFSEFTICATPLPPPWSTRGCPSMRCKSCWVMLKLEPPNVMRTSANQSCKHRPVLLAKSSSIF